MQVRTPRLPRNQAAQRAKGKRLSSPTRAKLWQFPNTTRTQLVAIKDGLHICSLSSKVRSGIYCSWGFEGIISSPMDKNPEEPQCVCANNYVEYKETESVLFSILFSPEDKKKKRRQKNWHRAQRDVSMMQANYDQYSTLTSNPQFPWCYFRHW